MSSTEEPAEYGMVMPFVAVASKGGPFDDASYCAGYEMGQLDAALQLKPRQLQVTIRTVNVAQADLVAMRRGYTSEAHPQSECGTWTWVEFEPMRAVSDSEEPR